MRGPAAGPGQGWTWRDWRAPGDVEFEAQKEEGSAWPPRGNRPGGCGPLGGLRGRPGWAPAASG